MIRFLVLLVFVLFNLNSFSQKDNLDSIFKSFKEIDFERLDTKHLYILPCNAKGIYSSSPTVYHSKGMRCLFDIYKIYVGKNKKDEYYLKNSCYLIRNKETEHFVNEIEKKTAKFELNKKALAELKIIYASYQKWIKLVEKKGIKYVQMKKISPLANTKYYWTVKG